MADKCVHALVVRSAVVMAAVCFTSGHVVTEMFLESGHKVLFDTYQRVDLS